MKAELEKAKKAAWMAEKASEALEQKSYNIRVQETKTCLAEKLAEVCREYYQELWTEALKLAGILTTSEWWKAENIFYPLDIREALEALLGPTIDATPTTTIFEKFFTAQVSLPSPEVSKGPGKASDEGQR